MKKVFFLCAFALLSTVCTVAQTSAKYRYDNFDTQQGVRIEVSPNAIISPMKQTRLTAKAASSTKTGSPLPQRSGNLRLPSGMTMSFNKTLKSFTTGDANVDTYIIQSGSRNDVDPVLLYAIMHRESAFKKHAISHKGARGLMQLMPGTAARFGVNNIFDPRQNIEGGARYVRFLLNTFGGDVALALAGYNAGEGAVLKYGRRVPPYSETQEYVRRIAQRYALMRDPQTARIAPIITPAQAVVAATSSEPTGLVYERNVFAVRLPNGSLRLISQ